MIAVCVTLTLKPGQIERFLPLLQAHGTRCLDREPGCHRFDIGTDNASTDTVFIYELYGSRGDFDAHLETDHFRAFDAEVTDMVAEKRILIWDRLETL